MSTSDFSPGHRALPRIFANPKESQPAEITQLLFQSGSKRPAIIAALIAGYMVVGLVIKMSGIQLSGLALEASRIAVGRGSRLFVAFVFGILVYVLRYRIPYTALLITGCVTLCLGVAIFANPGESFPVLNAMLAIPLAYLTVCVGVTKSRFLRSCTGTICLTEYTSMECRYSKP